MRIPESCARCLMNKQQKRSDDPAFLSEVRKMLDNRTPEDTSPWMVYQFNCIFEQYFGPRDSFRQEKQQFNDLVLSMEAALRTRIEASADPLVTALLYARIGNYIDFGAMNQVDESTFLSLFDHCAISGQEAPVIRSFLEQCAKARSFLLLADNCGEIVLDKLFLEQLKKAFPALQISVMVRGADVLNDATEEDAVYAGIPALARVLSNGLPVPGTVYSHLPPEARSCMDTADVILSKGQGNYESLWDQGRHIFYSFLCKCDLFTERFGVPKLTGMFLEENPVVSCSCRESQA